MQALLTLEILSLMIFFFSSNPLVQAVEICPYFSCNHHRHDRIQFPFRVTRNQTNRCGFPGFELSCSNSNGQTLLNLPSSNNNNPFIVQAIDYSYQVLWISDPNNCIPNRILNSDFNLTGSPYWWGPDSAEYSFMNCSKLEDPTRIPDGASVISCLSGGNYTVVSTSEKSSEEKMERELKCEVIKRVVAPLWWPEGFYPEDMSDVFMQLSWDIPGCQNCAIRGGFCGFVGDSGLSVGCFESGGNGNGNGGLPWSVKYGLILGAGIPGLICVIGLTFYLSGRVRAYNHNRRQLANNLQASSSPAIFPQPIILTLGLDGPTIESYPKTTLGESRRLPKPNDHGTCPICLSEYQPKETLRSIPECNHYFHAECIDEWLRLNGTCPLCRNSPQKASS